MSETLEDICTLPDEGEWIHIIGEATPRDFGINFTGLLGRIQDAWEKVEGPKPYTPATMALLAMVEAGTVVRSEKGMFRRS